MPTQPQKLTRREREIMDILFGLGQAAAEEIRERLTDPPSYSAVRTMLARLEARDKRADQSPVDPSEVWQGAPVASARPQAVHVPPPEAAARGTADPLMEADF